MDKKTFESKPQVQSSPPAAGAAPKQTSINRREFIRWSATGLGAASIFMVLPGVVAAQVPRNVQNFRSIAGQWRFRIDPEDSGTAREWFKSNLPDRIRLPGSLQEQGFGNNITLETPWTSQFGEKMYYEHPIYKPYRQPDKIRVPFILQPEKHYIGPAWYQREIHIPGSWDGKRIGLWLERCHWETTVWIDDKKIGSNDSLGTPHNYNLTEHVSPRSTYRLTVRIDNSMIVNVGPNAHSISDQTQTAWNGVIGAIGLTAGDRVWIDNAQVYPDLVNRTVRVRVTIGNMTGAAARGTLAFKASSYNTGAAHSMGPQDAGFFVNETREEVEIELAMGANPLLWDEFDPALYRLSIEMDARADGSSFRDKHTDSFGIREFRVDGTQFRINGRPVMLRGNLECCIFPRTGYPPTDVSAWRNLMECTKAYGLNHLRFHSWCPPRACFQAADEVGIYLLPEVSEWATINTPEQHDFFRRESERMLRYYGNHASFIMLALGNENFCEPEIMRDLLQRWKKDPRRLYTGKCNSNRSVIDEYEFNVTTNWEGEYIKHKLVREGMKTGTKLPPATDFDFQAMIDAYGSPLIAHETVQRCSYPSLKSASKYTGSLNPSYLDIARDQLEARGMLDQADAFAWASGRWQVEQFKEEIESGLRTKNMAGFQLLSLQDFPGQGTALVGVLDAFWESKGYVDAKEFTCFCAATVPLARMKKLTWQTSETLSVDVELSHFGAVPLSGTVLRCRVVDGDDQEVFATELGPIDVHIGNGIQFGHLEVGLYCLDAPAAYRLILDIPGTDVRNHWQFWVYPGDLCVMESGAVKVVSTLDDETVRDLEDGARVLLLPPRDQLHAACTDAFRSTFWTSVSLAEAWGPGGGHTMGILTDPGHPVFRHFPTESHTNWQWFELLQTCQPMILDDWQMVQHAWPKDHRPTIQMIDSWKYNRKLGVLAEARVGRGRLAICSMDIETDLDNRPVARQFRHSLMTYLNSDEFAPKQRVTPENVHFLFIGSAGLSTLQKLGASLSADSYQSGFLPQNAMDNQPNTLWHTPWTPSELPMPHHLTIDLKAPQKVAGFSYTPRPRGDNGRIAKFEIRVSSDGKNWSEPLASGTWPNTARTKKVAFTNAVNARHVRLIALSEVNGNPFASAAEVDVLLADGESR